MVHDIDFILYINPFYGTVDCSIPKCIHVYNVFIYVVQYIIYQVFCLDFFRLLDNIFLLAVLAPCSRSKKDVKGELLFRRHRNRVSMCSTRACDVSFLTVLQ